MVVAACDASGPETPRLITLSITGTPPTTLPSPSIQISSVQLVLAGIGLAEAGTCCSELALDPHLVDLPPSPGSPRKVLDATVRAATYTRLHAELHAAGSLTAYRDWPAGVSVRVVGVYTDPGGVTHDFTFTSGVDAPIDVALSRPVRVDARTRNLTIAVDVARWFRDAAGAAIDPTSGANAAAISANIQRSFAAFQDDDEDGIDDGDEVDEDDGDQEDEDDDDQDDADDDDQDDDDDDDQDDTDDDDDEDPPSPLRR